MFVVYVGSILTTLLWLQALTGHAEAPSWFILNVSIWLWFTVLFSNIAEALAEGRSKAQAASLRGLKQTVVAKQLAAQGDRAHQSPVRRICCAGSTSSWSKPGTTFQGTAT